MSTKSYLFETKSCGRCGGSGSYSYCQMHGSRCFGCGGTGIQLTNRGSAAQRHLHSELQSTEAHLVRVGEWVYYEDFFSGRARFCQVTAIRTDDPSGQVILELSRGGKVVVSYGTYPQSRLRWVRDEAHRKASIAAALEYQATLGVNGKPLKKKEASHAA